MDDNFSIARTSISTNVILLMRSQILVLRRFESELSSFRYPAYDILLQYFLTEESVKEAGPDDYLDAACELLFRSCLVSPMNAEEVVAQRGVSVLWGVIRRYCHGMWHDDKGKGGTPASSASILSSATRTMCGLAYFKSGRQALCSIPDVTSFVSIWSWLCGKPVAKKWEQEVLSLRLCALEGLTHMLHDDTLLPMFVECGICWILLERMLEYDPTTQEGHPDCEDATLNRLAMVATRSLSTICARDVMCSQASPRAALEAALTTPMVTLLGGRPEVFLSTLTRNVERTDLIWTTSMRSQLWSLVRNKAESSYTQGVMQDSLALPDDFGYDSIRNEIFIGGAYVRILASEGPSALTTLKDSSHFARLVVLFLATCVAAGAGEEERVVLSRDEREALEKDGSLALTADPDGKVVEYCFSVVKYLSGTDWFVHDVLLLESGPVIILAMPSLVSDPMVGIPCNPIAPGTVLTDLQLRLNAVEALANLCELERFAAGVVTRGCLWRLINFLTRDMSTSSNGQSEVVDRDTRGKAWESMVALASHRACASHIASTHCWLEILGVLLGLSGFVVTFADRLGAARVLGRLLWEDAVADDMCKLTWNHPVWSTVLSLSMAARCKVDATISILFCIPPQRES